MQRSGRYAGRMLIAGLWVFALCHGTVWADTVAMKDGSTVIGAVKKFTDGKLVVETGFAGEIEIAWDQVERLDTETVLPIHLQDGSVIEGTVRSAGPALMELNRAEGGAVVPVTKDEIVSLNPPPPPPVVWRGTVVGNLSVAGGNTDEQAYGLSADLHRRTAADRIDLSAGYFYSERDGEASRDDQFIAGKYDYFFNQKLFGYLNSRLDRDEIKDLRLRTTGGGGLGYQFIENDIHNLFAEGGVSYVNEDFELDIDDETYVAGRLAGHFGWWIMKDRLLFEEDLEFLLSVEDTEDWIGISDTRLTWKWTDQWSMNGSVRFEYDNTPATGKKEEDVKYILGIGYSF